VQQRVKAPLGTAAKALNDDTLSPKGSARERALTTVPSLSHQGEGRSSESRNGDRGEESCAGVVRRK
jgi:hypothetical protein